MSMYWPSHSSTHVSSYRRMSRRTLASLKPRSVRRCSATRLRLKIRSPVLIACGTPWSAQSVARWRRSTSPSSMSSWTRLKLWPSSTAAAPGRARAWSPAIDAYARRPSSGRMRLPRGPSDAVEPQVVADHLVDAGRRRIAVVDDAQDLGLGVGEEPPQVDVVGDGHGGASVAGSVVNVFAESSLLDAAGRDAATRRSATVGLCPPRAATSPMPSSSPGSTWARPTAS